MSRLGKLPIKIPAGVKVSANDKDLVFVGPKGEWRLPLMAAVTVKISEQELNLTPAQPDDKEASASWGLMWSLVRNSVIGVSEGFRKQLEINGVGYRASVSGNKLNMSLGFSHPVEFTLPAGVQASVANNVITLESIDKHLLGETAAQIRRIRKPEPYKGKGVKYIDEVIRRKAGKAAAKGK